MYRFLLRPKWIVFHVVVAAAVVAMLSLSSWQWTKYNQRSDFVDKVEQRMEAEPVELAPLLSTKSPGEIEYTRVTATGSYVPGAQLTEINRVQDGVNGVNVLTLFRIDGGPVVVVNRGFVATGVDVPDPPTGTLLIGGTARTSQARRTGELTDNDDGARTEVRRVDLPSISETLGTQVAAVYIDFIASKPPTAEPPVPVPAPDLTGGPPHLSYAVQWIIFSIAVIVGWVFAVRRSTRTRRRAAAKASAELTDLRGERPVRPSA